MPTFEKTLEIVLNPTAYAHVAKAAERLGLSIREFAAIAVHERALAVLEATERNEPQPSLELSADDRVFVDKFLNEHPEWIEPTVEKAHANTASP